MDILLTNTLLIIVMASLAAFVLLCGTWAWMNYRSGERALIERGQNAALGNERAMAERNRAHPISRLNHQFDQTRAGKWVQRQIIDTTIARTPFEFAVGWFAIWLLLVYINALTFHYPTVPVSIVIGIGIIAFARFYIKRKRREYYELLELQFVEFARGMVSTTRAGMSIAQGLQFTAKRLPFPSADFFAQISREINLLNVPVMEALEHAEARVDSRNFQTLVAAFLIHQKAGGNLVRALRTLVNVMQTRIDTQAEIDAMVNPLKATAIVVILIPVVAVLGLVLMDDTLQEAILHPIGIVLTVIFLITSVLAYFLLYRMTDIKA